MPLPLNPPAFPFQASNGVDMMEPDYGMTLRDWFAGQALNGGLVRDSYADWQLRAWFGERGGLMPEEIAAKAAYVLADAMLAERERRP